MIDLVRVCFWFNWPLNNNNYSVLDAETKEAPTFTFDARLAYRTATNGTWEKLAEARENRSLVCHFTKSQVNILLKKYIANKLFFPVFIFIFIYLMVIITPNLLITSCAYLQ